jgi:hypothetical protein
MRCIGCACTENRACQGGCSWLCVNPPKCSACVETGILHLSDHIVHRIAASLPRRDDNALVLQSTGRRLSCR